MCHPGMVHFILIDRSFDEMITPSVHRDHPVVYIASLYTTSSVSHKLSPSLSPSLSQGLAYVDRLAEEKGITSGELLKKTVSSVTLYQYTG